MPAAALMRRATIEPERLKYMDDTRKKMRDIHDEVPPDYYDTSMATNPFQRFWHTRRVKVISEMLRGEGGLMLDIGCAGGTLLELIRKKAGLKTTIGIDASFEAIKYANTRHKGPSFLCADFYELPFKDSTFGCVSAIEVLEHLMDPGVALKELNRCLKKGGSIVILVPNEQNLLFRMIWYFWTLGKGKVWKDAHVQQFTRESMGRLLSSEGFKVTETRMFILGMLMAMKGVKER